SHAITATFAPTDSTNYTTTTNSVSITVNAAAPTITWAAPAAITYGTALSGTQLNASSSIAGTLSYSPAAGAVLTAGSHAITATFAPTDSTDYTTTTNSVSITVNAATPIITWATPAAIGYGTALSGVQLNASSSIAGTFTYSPAAGTLLTAGSHAITATFTPTDLTDYTMTTNSVSITVNAAIPVITWAAPAAIPYGTALSGVQLDASSTVAGTFSYSPAAGTVLTAGSHAITATFTPTDLTDYTTTSSSVSITVNAVTPVITWAAPAAITYGTALSGTQLNASSTVAGTFSYSPAAGTVLTAGSHAITATFTPSDSINYRTTTSSVSITVNTVTPVITWAAPAAITYGTALSGTQLNASSTMAGTFSYSPAAGTVLTAGSHAITATFTPTDSTDYTTTTSSVSITVNTVTPVITWAAPAAITYGTALSGTQLNASSTVAGTFSYSPAAGTVLTAGSRTLSVTFSPTDATDYKGVTATVTLTVKRATPVVSWTTPAAILYGTALSGTQLDASSTIPGVFAYTPIAGTVLAVGSQTLSVTLTPTDTTDYANATKTVKLTVNQGISTLSINATTIAFGSTNINTPLTQSVTLTSTGTAAVTVNSATVTGAGFSVAGCTFPATLTPGQAVTLSVEFDPTTAGAATGQLTVTSTSSTNSTATIALTGTGAAAAYAVNLSWDAPSSSQDPVSGYAIYRAPSGGTVYQMVNSSVDANTAYVDSTVQSGQSYEYYVESVDASGIESAPSNTFSVTIP
ncbi:MAG: choice-of-anchor D domain-containing protein, partial [Terracidiphilus sp.]